MTQLIAQSSLAYAQIGGWGVKTIVAELHGARNRWRAAQQRSREFAVREFPSREALTAIAEALCGALFPMRLGPPDLHQEGEDFYVGHTLDRALNALFQQVQLELGYNRRLQCQEREDVEAHAAEIVQAFARQLPAIRGLLDSDVEAAYQGDPAARSVDEVLLCYPGVLAMIHHRLAHCLYQLGLPLLARIVSELAHSQTGIDIHPGAQIDEGFFIEPTVFVDVEPHFSIVEEEIFGPVITIYVYDDNKYEETLELCDRTSPYGLTGSIFARDRYAIDMAFNKLRYAAGNFYINDKPTGAVIAQQPFGGSRASGTNDKAGGPLNLIRWTNARCIKEALVPPTSYGYPFLGEK